ncbi:tRNA1(Val) (adenine(37)-N6)-methyltransferase [Spongiivirga citrea]|uniref:tRNA1(Val) (adenine(37)-N6)-methyltransferase n=1 Tax=Spongiivirga citrea TaxID=1481457 RepID=A0A6M0CQK4_9FLAO|nr:methyltransferase [Spongiivirga citrea]NER18159.1 methyltransferase [Spongiivirga citrea]
MNKPFQFKQFSVKQDKCAMKIGTDGVLLGSWARIDHNPFSILDIGSGTGILSLMLAQRCHAEVIEAIEIDSDAYEQCAGNFESSPWNDRLFCYHAGLLEFAQEVDDEFDLIVSNPPFYKPTETITEKARATARFQDAMPFEHLIACTAKLLSEVGKFAVIIPFDEEEGFIELSKNYGLFTERITRVKGTEEASIKRSLLQFSKIESIVEEGELVIEKRRHDYTEDYIALTKDFYMKM